MFDNVFKSSKHTLTTRLQALNPNGRDSVDSFDEGMTTSSEMSSDGDDENSIELFIQQKKHAWLNNAEELCFSYLHDL